MAITDHSIALASIIASGIVATAGVLVPAWIHTLDKREDARLRLLKDRRDTYLAISELTYLVHVGSEEKAKDLAYKAAASIALWSSEEVKDLFDSWIALWQESEDASKKTECVAKADVVREVLRKLMAKEIQKMNQGDK
jgi:hypothetical protein